MNNAYVIGSIINIVSALVNIYWIIRLSALKGKDETIHYWKEECEKRDSQLTKKDEAIDRLVKKKDQYKVQYLQQQSLNQHLSGQLHAYERQHGKQ